MLKKRTLILLLTLLAVCLLVSGVYMIANRTAMRQPTQQEIEACAPYTVDWQAATGMEETDKAIILSLCTYREEQTIGANLYQVYDSDTLGNHLHNFREMIEIAVLGETLYVQYTTNDGTMITLAYDDAGMAEKVVYDPETDTCYYEYADSFEVWTKFRNGFKLGA